MNKIFVILSLFVITKNSFADITCTDSVTDYFLIYEPNEHTCQNGEFLPSGIDSCQPCPTGYVCAGGTFSFNPTQYQGASLYASTPETIMNNVCADNFPTDLYAILEPNTVILNYDDGIGNITTKTCTYDGLVSIPDTPPEREGYIFSGWTVKKHNND